MHQALLKRGLPRKLYLDNTAQPSAPTTWKR
ncbi:hypothetical protein DFAR_2800017 [Desulfarculales bacterium]